jgi:hypothetical protein
MHTIRANGHTSETKHPPAAVTEAICTYLAGKGPSAAAEASGVPPSTICNILDRHDLRHSPTEARILDWVQAGKVSQVARRRLIERRWTRYEAHDRVPQLAVRFDVTEETIRRDLRAIGYGLSRSERSIRREWGSFADWRAAQEEAHRLVREEGRAMTAACETTGWHFQTLERLLEAYDDRTVYASST